MCYYQGSYNQGYLQSGVLTIRGSYNQGFLLSGFLRSEVLTIKGSYDQRFLRSGALQSGVQINVSYMTSLCADVDIDRKI